MLQTYPTHPEEFVYVGLDYRVTYCPGLTIMINPI